MLAADTSTFERKCYAEREQLQAENRRLKAELVELQERYDDLAHFAVRVAGHSS